MKALGALFAFLFILLIGGGVAAVVLLPKFTGPGPLEAEKDMVIARGTGISAIGHQLEKEGVIRSYYAFRLHHVLDGTPDLKAGEYLFGPHETLQNVIMKMATGEVVVRKVTVPEGTTSAAVVEMLKQEKALTGDIAAIPPEGSLAPDTYRFAYGDSRQGLIDQMQKEMQAAVDNIWAQRDADTPLQNPQQMVALASIVEKETGLAAERPRVAGVYVNRMRKNMLLQSDPTVIYGITHGAGPLARPITITDLTTPTPYNTYTQQGLPPGPIANPGKASLMAAAKPEKHEFIYFVADGSGGHKFAATLEQHNQNVAAWRQFQKGGAALTAPAPPPSMPTPVAAPALVPAQTPPPQPVAQPAPQPVKAVKAAVKHKKKRKH
ncbi:MAG TPA: endolytic transglycosylase MltG [Alphaproteobacteria bacterium]|nr:endolytic transglycosylase MltG [Alphaproteobacteria bacterium]